MYVGPRVEWWTRLDEVFGIHQEPHIRGSFLEGITELVVCVLSPAADDDPGLSCYTSLLKQSAECLAALTGQCRIVIPTTFDKEHTVARLHHRVPPSRPDIQSVPKEPNLRQRSTSS